MTTAKVIAAPELLEDMLQFGEAGIKIEDIRMVDGVVEFVMSGDNLPVKNSGDRVCLCYMNVPRLLEVLPYMEQAA